ncbi:hypothetical protein D3C80_1391560 [compost metagenome]
MFHHVAHAAEHNGFVVAAGFQELGQFGLAPGSQPVFLVATQAGGYPTVNRRVAAGQVIVAVVIAQRFLLHGNAARRVAGTAVPQTFHQIASTLDHRIGFGVSDKIRRRRRKHAAPDAQRPAH